MDGGGSGEGGGEGGGDGEGGEGGVAGGNGFGLGEGGGCTQEVDGSTVSSYLSQSKEGQTPAGASSPTGRSEQATHSSQTGSNKAPWQRHARLGMVCWDRGTVQDLLGTAAGSEWYH